MPELRQSEIMVNSQLEAGLASIRMLVGKPDLQELKTLHMQILEQRIALEARSDLAKKGGNNVALLQKHLSEVDYYLDQTDQSIRLAQGFYDQISQSTAQVNATRKFEYQMEQTVQYLRLAYKNLVTAQEILERLYAFKPWRFHE